MPPIDRRDSPVDYHGYMGNRPATGSRAGAGSQDCIGNRPATRSRAVAVSQATHTPIGEWPASRIRVVARSRATHTPMGDRPAIRKQNSDWEPSYTYTCGKQAGHKEAKQWLGAKLYVHQ